MATDNLGFPFDSINHDRTMSSASFRKLFRSFFTNGIFSTNDLYVTANNLEMTFNSYVIRDLKASAAKLPVCPKPPPAKIGISPCLP